ncbi:MAG: hypothetical protein ABIE47_05465 [Pseudomonadota bacterium]|uniref:Uncharacterized protein n=1 Tax=viral metagenome TaxID=1070528 RepID=A0A6M3LI29_9ZZZZ
MNDKKRIELEALLCEKEEIELCERCGFPESDHPRTTCWGEEEKPNYLSDELEVPE